ncbi:MAG: hypothetical protein METHAR1v1_1260012 [Methanothrix sp.]|nr:MAG: hypothetical protein METHAR1v1_1260012 [Methanothrix sp.]
MGAEAAPLAVVQIRDEVPIDLVDAALGTVDLAEAALDALIVIEDRDESSPGAGFCYFGAPRLHHHSDLASGQELTPS